MPSQATSPRVSIHVTLTTQAKNMLQRLAREAGLPVSYWIEAAIREAHEKKEQR